MPVYAGNKNLTLYWGAGDAQGMSNVRLYLGDKLVYIPFRPPEGDLLLAGSGTYLKGGADVYLDYKNTPQVQNELDGLHLGNAPFTFSFRVNGAYIGQGTRFLLDFPGLIRAKSDRHTLAFMTDVYKPGVWQYVSPDVLTDGWNAVSLGYAGDKLKLTVNAATYTLADKKTVATRRVSGFSEVNYLKLKSAYSYLNSLVMNNEIAEEELHVMHKILNKEVIAKEENNRLYNVKVAAFPFLRKVDDYDFNFQPGIKEEKIRSIIESDFYENATNIVFVGNPGTGKTHLAIAIAYTVAIRRNSVYFIKFNKLINILRQAYNEGTLERKLRLFYKYKLLVIDEVGFNEITPLEAKLFFQLIDLRYTKRSTIFTSNISFDKWPQILGNDEMITKAILDRILHYSYLFNITGPSYRIKDKLNPKKTENT